MNEPCIYALIWLLFYVWAEMIAILISRMYSPVPSEPFSWLSCLICWMDVVRYLSSFSLDLEVKECAARWHDDYTSPDVKRLKEVMLSKIWFLFEIKTLVISPVCLCLQWLKISSLVFYSMYSRWMKWSLRMKYLTHIFYHKALAQMSCTSQWRLKHLPSQQLYFQCPDKFTIYYLLE